MSNSLTLEVSIKELPLFQELISILSDQMSLVDDILSDLGAHLEDYDRWSHGDKASSLRKRLYALLEPGPDSDRNKGGA